MFAGARVLIVEDDFFTALDLVEEIEACGGTVVGPYGTVRVALRALETASVDAAILDANLADRDVTPVALLLLERHVPLIIHTGVGLPDALKRWSGDLPVVMKPADAATATAALELQLHKGH